MTQQAIPRHRRRWAVIVGALVIASFAALLTTTSDAPARAYDGWDNPATVSNGSSAGYSPRVAFMADGSAVAVWQSTARKQVWGARSTDTGLTWSTPVLIGSLGTRTVASLDLSVDDGGRAVVAWTASGTLQLFSSVTADAGQTWSAPTAIGTDKVNEPHIVSPASGVFAITWTTQTPSTNVRAAWSADSGATWAAPQTIAANVPGLLYSEVDADAGTVVLAWGQSDGGAPAVGTSTTRDLGVTWSAAEIVGPNWSPYLSPAVEVTADGRSFIASQSLVSADVYAIEAVHRVGVGAWSAPSRVSGEGTNGMVTLAAGTAGDTVASWYRQDTAGTVWVDSATSQDNGATWSAPQELFSAGYGIYDPPRLIVGPQNIFVAATTETVSLGRNTLVRRSLDGGATWDTAANVSAASAWWPVVAVDDQGSLVTMWALTGSQTVQASGTAIPVVTSSAPADATLGATYLSTLAASGTAPITWSLESGALPAGLAIDAGGVISGVPTASGTSSFTVRASNSAGWTDAALSIDVPAAPPVITSGTPQGATVGESYSFTFTATGVAPITWAVTAGTLPSGLSLNSAGALNGTPTTTGSSAFTVTVTDASGTATQDVTLTVAVAAVAPVITSASTIVNVIEGAPFDFPFTATGTGPFTWAVVSGALALSLDGPHPMGASVAAALPTSGLPPGLSVSSSGLLSGTPTAAGTYAFTIRATGPGGAQDQSVEVTVIPVSSEDDLAGTGSRGDVLVALSVAALLAATLGVLLMLRRRRV